MNITERLMDLRDAAYQQFQSRIVPNVPIESILGVRVPMMRKFAKELEPVLEKWLSSEQTYTVRFAINMYMHEFLGEDFDERFPRMIAAKQGDDYYLRMVIAWYFATALAKQYDAVLPYIENHE